MPGLLDGLEPDDVKQLSTQALGDLHDNGHDDPGKLSTQTLQEVGQLHYTKKLKNTPPEVGLGEALQRGELSGLTFNKAPQVLAGVETAKQWVKGNPKPLGDIYEREKGLQFETQAAANEQHPIASTVGQIAGSIPAGLAAGITSAPQIAGAAMVSRYGANPGETPEEERAGMLKEGATQGLIGAGANYVTNKLPGVLSGAKESLENFAGERGFKAAGAQLRDERLANKQFGSPQNIGQQLLKEGIVEPGDNVDRIAEKAAAKAKDYGQQINTYVKRIKDEHGEAPGIDMVAVANKIKSEIGDELKGVPFAGSQRERIAKESETLLEPYELKDDTGKIVGYKSVSFEDATMLRRKLDAQISKAYKNPNANPFQQEQMKFRKILDEAIDSHLDTLGGESSVEFKALKNKYRISRTAQDMAEDKLLRDNSNRFFSPTDYLVGGAGAAAGAAKGYQEGGVTGAITGGIEGAALGATHKLIRERGPSTFAGAAQGIANKIPKNPEALGKFADVLKGAAARGQGAYQATHNIMYKNNPEYRKLIDSQNEGPQQ